MLLYTSVDADAAQHRPEPQDHFRSSQEHPAAKYDGGAQQCIIRLRRLALCSEV